MRFSLGQIWLIIAVASCATARVEEIEPGIGGVITVNPPQDPEAKSKARALMAENCGRKKARIVKEGYVVVGSEATGSESSSTSSGNSLDLFNTKKNTSSTTTQLKEWRLNYKCE